MLARESGRRNRGFTMDKQKPITTEAESVCLACLGAKLCLHTFKKHDLVMMLGSARSLAQCCEQELEQRLIREANERTKTGGSINTDDDVKALAQKPKQ
jgi:hypothetical protein